MVSIKVIHISIIIMVLTTTVYPVNSIRGDIDPVPYALLLDTYISTILSQDLNKELELYNHAISLVIDDLQLKIVHQRAYKILHDISLILNNTQMIIGIGLYNIDHDKLLDMIRKSYTKLLIYDNELDDYIYEYVKRLEQYVYSKPAFFKYKNRIYEKIHALHKLLSRYISQLEDLYSSIISNSSIESLILEINIPEKVYAGQSFKFIVNVENPYIKVNDKYTNIIMTLLMGPYYRDIENYTIINSSSIEALINVPDADTIESYGIDIVRDRATREFYATARISVKIVYKGGNNTYIGSVIRDFRVLLEPPKIVVKTPSYAYINSTMLITIYSYVKDPINISIYLDRVEHDRLIMNKTIMYGVNKISLNTSNIEPGYHTLFFKIHPDKQYMSSMRSSAIAIIHKTVSATMSLPNLLFGPPFTLNIHGKVYDNVKYRVRIIVDDIAIYDKVLKGKNIYLYVDLPITLQSIMIWFRSIEVWIIPLNKTYQPTVFTVNALSVNILFVFILLIMIGIVYLHPMISRPLITLPSWIRRIISYRVLEERGITYLKPISMIYLRYRSMKTKRYYKLFIKTLASLTRPMMENETLREYINNVKDDLPEGIKDYVVKLTSLFEEDMYSNHHINLALVKRYMREIIRVLKS